MKPGERVPLDGVIVAGASEVDQSPLTGESRAVARAAGDGVFAGSINGAGALEVRVTRASHDTTLARVLRRVEEAQSSRAPSQGFVEAFARLYTPAVVARRSWWRWCRRWPAWGRWPSGATARSSCWSSRAPARS